MTSDRLKTILLLCKELDVLASKLYTKIAKKQTEDDKLSFWLTMAKEERDHVLFWKKCIDYSNENTIPDIFDDMDQVVEELSISKNKATDLLNSIDINGDSHSYFLIAYWMEFYLLYPSFINIFHYMGILSSDHNPEESYEIHLLEFVDGFSKFGKTTPEMELLGSLLHNLWKRNKELVGTSMYDNLTQLFNRKGLTDTMITFASLAQRNHYKIGIMMIDIDNFKNINDTLGHQSGDHVLKKIAAHLRTNVRKSDLIGRYGGEEFIVFIVNTDLKSITALGEKIRESISHIKIDSINVTVSIGCSVKEISTNDINKCIEDTIRVADDNLYRAKRSGKNRVEI